MRRWLWGDCISPYPRIRKNPRKRLPRPPEPQRASPLPPAALGREWGAGKAPLRRGRWAKKLRPQLLQVCPSGSSNEMGYPVKRSAPLRGSSSSGIIGGFRGPRNPEPPARPESGREPAAAAAAEAGRARAAGQGGRSPACMHTMKRRWTHNSPAAGASKPGRAGPGGNSSHWAIEGKGKPARGWH